MTVSLPLLGERTRVAHGSPPAFAVVGARVGASVTFDVGSGRAVSVGRRVCVGVSVGGGSVAVGIAALDHETGNDPVKRRTVIETFLG